MEPLSKTLFGIYTAEKYFCNFTKIIYLNLTAKKIFPIILEDLFGTLPHTALSLCNPSSQFH